MKSPFELIRDLIAVLVNCKCEDDSIKSEGTILGTTLKKNICVFRVSRPYLGFWPDPKHFIVLKIIYIYIFKKKKNTCAVVTKHTTRFCPCGTYLCIASCKNGYRQTVQAQIRRLRTRRMIRIFILCIQVYVFL